MGVLKFVTHGKRVQKLATDYGWFPGARYTNLRDVRDVGRLGFLDIDWRSYSFDKHLKAAMATNPMLTVARDISRKRDLKAILKEAVALNKYADNVILVPKDPSLANSLEESIPRGFILGFSVPTSYGETTIPPSCFVRPVHLLGGRPDVQRRLAEEMTVVSLDCNRFTLDACYGDYFDGSKFRPHRKGGYERCIRESLRNINALWSDYVPLRPHLLQEV